MLHFWIADLQVLAMFALLGGAWLLWMGLGEAFA